MTPFAPLAGIRVVDAAGGVAAPFAAQLLRWLGAAVDKVDGPDDLLLDLHRGPASTGAALDDYVNAGKRRHSATSAAVHEAVLRDLVEGADVLVTDGTVTAPDLHHERLRAERPELVVVAVTGYGLTGPHAGRPASELSTYHGGGQGPVLPGGIAFRQFPDRPPVRAGRFLADYDAGLAAAVGALAALARRRVAGAGDLVDVSAQDVQLGLDRATLTRAFHEGIDLDRGYLGYDYAGVLPCTDGFFCLRPSEARHWTGFTDAIGRPDLATDPRFATRAARFDNGDALNAVLGEWTRTVDRATVREAVLRAGCPGGPYLEAADVVSDPAIVSRGLIQQHPTGGRAPASLFQVAGRSAGAGPVEALADRMRGATAPLPLAGLRVLDLTWVAAGPYTTALLTFLGAEVIKIESRDRPDLFRRDLYDPHADLDASIRFADLNQGKESVCLDLKAPADRERLLALAQHCDVLVENYRPGVRDRLGLSDAALHARNPALVTVSMSGFGATASDASRPGYASIFSAESGLSALTGYPDAPPTDIRDPNDLRAGTAGAVAALAGILAALQDGRGTALDSAARDVLIALQGDAVLQASRGLPVTRSANALPECVPYGCYPAGDGWIAVSVRTAAEWTALVGVLDLVALRDPDLLDPAVRVKQRAALDDAVAAWCTGRTAADAADLLCAAGVPASASTRTGDLLLDEHLRARGMFPAGPHPRLGRLTMIGAPWRFASAKGDDWATASGREHRPPLLDEHRGRVLHDLLGE